jgi:import receptor subunit TOM20
MMKMEISKTALGIAAGVAGTLFLGYCIYFDQKRRLDPEYKKKVRERRRKQKKTGATGSRTEMPNLADHEAVQRFFLQEIQMGEALISSGEIEKGVEHLANAVVVCGQPSQLLQVLQQTLPAQVFTLLIQRMRSYANSKVSESDTPVAGRVSEDLNEDLE